MHNVSSACLQHSSVFIYVTGALSGVVAVNPIWSILFIPFSPAFAYAEVRTHGYPRDRKASFYLWWWWEN